MQLRKIVYLDQNKWSNLCDHANDSSRYPNLVQVLNTLRGKVTDGNIVVPLSLGHYMETHGRANAESRTQLAKFMFEISGWTTIAPPNVIVPHELAHALREYFPQIHDPGSLKLLGFGYAHAAGDAKEKDRISDFFRTHGLDPEDSLINSEVRKADHLLQLASMGATTEFGHSRVDVALLAQPRAKFQNRLNGLAEKLSTLRPGQQKELLEMDSLNDISTAFDLVLGGLEIPRASFHEILKNQASDLIAKMPSRKLDLHLSLQWAKMRGMRATPSELNDWAYLSVASMYCDIVVTEKRFADLVRRDGFQTRAHVISDLTRLPELLSA